MRAIGKQSYRLLASRECPVLMSTTRIIIQIVQIYLTVQIWARTGSNSRALCRVTAGPYPPRNYVSDDMASSHAETARQRGKRVGIQSPNLRPKAGLQFPTMQNTKPLVQIRMFVFANATAHATSLIPNGFQLPFASTVRNEPDIMLGARVQTVAYRIMQSMSIPEVFRSPRGSP